MSLHSHFGISGIPAKSGISENHQHLDQVAKSHLAQIKCTQCNHLGMISDGNSEGKLRLKCTGCQKTCYAHKHSVVIALANHLSQGLIQTNTHAVFSETTTQKNNILKEKKEYNNIKEKKEYNKLKEEKEKKTSNNNKNIYYQHSDIEESTNDESEAVMEFESYSADDKADFCLTEIDSLTSAVDQLKKERLSNQAELKSLRDTLSLILNRIDELTSMQRLTAPAAPAATLTSPSRHPPQAPWVTVV